MKSMLYQSERNINKIYISGFSDHLHHPVFVMPLKEHSSPVSPGTVLSVFCLLLCSAGFIRVEIIFKDYEQRLRTVEEVMPHNQLKRARKDLASTKEGNEHRSTLHEMVTCIYIYI